MMEMTKSTRKELNSEFLLNYKKSLGDFSLDLSLGGNRMYNLQESIYGGSGKFSVQGAYYLSLGTSQKCQNTKYEKEINSLYGFANIGYKNYLFLDITGRNDWSSTLPADNRSYFYPSFSFSGVVTSLLDEYGIYYPKDVISYGKIRASFAQVGKDTDPYQLSQTYSTQNGGFGYLYAYEPTTLANIKLKPEIANSLELGTEWKFFKGRYGFDFTYYKTITKNQVLDIPYIFSAGYTSKTANVGKISNKGIELTLSANVINSDKFNLDLNANFAKNVTRVNELDASVNMYEFGNMQNGLKVVAIEGHKLGEIYDNGYKRDSEGNKIIGSDGLPEKTDSQKVLGCIQPDFTGSFSIGAGYKRLSLSGLFSFQKGGDVYSFTEAKAANAGTAKCTADRSNRVVTGVTENGQANTMSITAQNYWQNGVNSEEFIYDASFIKLKELSLNYSFSKKTLKILSRNLINSLNVSVFGSNLFYLVKHTPGTTPDGSAISSNIFSQAVDFSPLPNSRTFGFSIKIGF
jgi:outer membrane receptor protein involved in Fe transport